jgi:hypothetical protein
MELAQIARAVAEAFGLVMMSASVWIAGNVRARAVSASVAFNSTVSLFLEPGFLPALKSLVAPLEPLFDERAKHPVLLVEAIEKKRKCDTVCQASHQLRVWDFIASHGGPPWFSPPPAQHIPAGYQRMVARAGEAAGFSFLIHSHMLRHSCGYKLANDGHTAIGIALRCASARAASSFALQASMPFCNSRGQ